MPNVDSMWTTLNAWVRSNHLLHDAIITKLAFCDVDNEVKISPLDVVLKIELKIPRDASGDYSTALLFLRGVSMMSIGVVFSSCSLYIKHADVSIVSLPNFCNREFLRLKIFGEQYSDRERKWIEKQIIDVAFLSYDCTLQG